MTVQANGPVLGPVTAFERGLDRLVKGLIRGCEVVTTAIGIWLMVALIAAVFYRYVLNDSLVWVDESSSILLVWLMLAVVPIGFHQYFHIAVTFVMEKVPRLPRVALALFVNACTAFFFAIAFYHGILNTVAEWETELFSIPLMRGWVTWTLPLASLIVLLVCLDNTLKLLRRGDLPPSEEGLE